MDAHKNLAHSTLSTPPSGTSGTSLVVGTGHGTRFPSTPFNATIWPAGVSPTFTNAEIVRVTGIASDTFTVTRAQEGTTAKTFTANSQIAATVTAKTLTDAEYGAHGAVNVKDPAYGAMGDDSTNDTVAIQAAIDAAGAGGTVIVPAGIYRCVGLTVTAANVRMLGLGKAILKKNGNGVILTVSGVSFNCQNIDFRGDASTPVYTGNNVHVTSAGSDPTFTNCGSRYAYGNALLSEASHTSVLGSNEIWATADLTGSGWDIVIGVSGTATLYHQLRNIVSTQATGGIKLIDTGSHTLIGGQFGKLHIDSGTSPAGVNAGMTMGCRILGAVTVDVSSAILIGNQFGASATIDFASGTSGHEYWGNVDSNAVITNAGNASAAIVRQVSNDGIVGLQFGDDTSLALFRMSPTNGRTYLPEVEIPNNASYRLMRASPNTTSRAGAFTATTGDNMQLTADVGSLQQVVATGQSFQKVVNSVLIETVSSKTTTAITDATPATAATISVTNVAASACIEFTVIGSVGAGGAVGANEASATNIYTVSLARVAGVNVVGVISTAFGAAVSNVAGGTTVTATLALGAVSGAVGATNTIPVNVTITKGGGASANHTARLSWRIVSESGSGVTVA